MCSSATAAAAIDAWPKATAATTVDATSSVAAEATNPAETGGLGDEPKSATDVAATELQDCPAAADPTAVTVERERVGGFIGVPGDR